MLSCGHSHVRSLTAAPAANRYNPTRVVTHPITVTLGSTTSELPLTEADGPRPVTTALIFSSPGLGHALTRAPLNWNGLFVEFSRPCHFLRYCSFW